METDKRGASRRRTSCIGVHRQDGTDDSVGTLLPFSARNGSSKIASFFNGEATTMQQLPETGYLRLSQIIGKRAKGSEPAVPAIIPVSRSTWWAGVKTGRYPQPVRSLGLRITAWRVEDIRMMIAAVDGRRIVE